MNILLINHYASYPDMGMEFRPYYMAKHWVDMGHQVSIVASSFSHLRIKNLELKEHIKEELIDGINYIWLKTNHYKGNGIGRIKNIITFIYKLYKFKNYISNKYKPKAIIASSTYPLDIYPSKALARKNNAKLIFEVHDLWPLSPKEVGGYSKYHPFIFTMQLAEDYAYKNSDNIISILPLAKKYMISRGLKEEKFHYIPNAIKIEEKNLEIPKSYSKLVESLKSDGFFLVAYVGGMSLSNALEYFIKSKKYLKEEKIAFILLGNGLLKEELSSMSKEYKNIFFLDPIKKDMVNNFLKKMDALIISWRKSPLYEFGISPNKIMDYMLSAKPIINAFSGKGDLIQEAKCGLNVEAENPQEIANAIRQIKSLSEKERDILGQNAKKYLIKNHSYDKLAKKFLDIIKV